MDYFIVIGLVIVAFFIGRLYEAFKIIDIIIEAHINELTEEQDTVVEKVSKLKTEKHGEILFLYDDNDTFVCQGSTLEELAKLSKQYKQIKYAAVMHDDKIFVFSDGTVKET